MAALPNGDLVAFFKTGAAHIGKSGRASMSRSTDGGKTWSAPATLFDIPNADDGVDANGLTRSGHLLAAAVSYTWNGERYTFDGWKADTYFLQSTDQGKSWSKPVKVTIAPVPVGLSVRPDSGGNRRLAADDLLWRVAAVPAG